MIKFLRINGAYFDTNNKYAIYKSFDGEWNIYRLEQPFKGYYVVTFKYLKDAKQYVMEKLE